MKLDQACYSLTTIIKNQYCKYNVNGEGKLDRITLHYACLTPSKMQIKCKFLAITIS